MQRRNFLRLGAAAAAAAVLRRASAATNGADAVPWRSFEVRYEVELAGDGPATLWIPLPQDAPGWQTALATRYEGNFSQAGIHRDAKYGARMFAARWEGEGARHAIVTTHAMTCDRAAPAAPAAGENPDLYLLPTPHMPLDGVVRERSREITRGLHDPMQCAQAVYEWVVDNTFREPKVLGCGTGDIKAMLENGTLGGKCADINALFVGLLRAAGVPAREVYGLRVADSRQFKSLGKSGDVSRAQHCRAEFFVAGRGWVAADPADVRKAVLEENLPVDDARVAALRKKLFGQWEMNWVAFNSARDFTLVPDAGERVNYLMYPNVRDARGLREGLVPDKFSYRISARELNV
ncbi:MAG: transglutaminase family protein [Rhodocyclaceae bacterium]|nr:transglutaminase family protein [Rhodocyclaceae bacterium]MBX3671144.1 transglutaminase family protein [Rhodocyclaceae bacterium]